MKLKRMTAAILALAMTLSAVSCSKEQQQNINYPTETDKNVDSNTDIDMSVESTNSIGKYVSKLSMQDENKKSKAMKSYSGNFSISNLTFDSQTGMAYVVSTQSFECKLAVKIINEKDNSVAVVSEKKVSAGSDTVTEIVLDNSDLPDYYYVTAELIDADNKILCPAFTFSNYTKEMQEILAADVNDFEPEYVVNFDENESTNFLVLSEETIVADVSNDVNTIVSADYENDVYVFDNADETVSSLEQGEYFFTYIGGNDAIAVEVESVEKNDDTVTLKGNSENIDDMFAFMKFEATADTSDAVVNTETADECVGEYVMNDSNVLTLDSPKIMSDEIKYDGEKSIDFPINIEDGALLFNANLNLKFYLNFNFYKRYDYKNINVALGCEQTYSVSASVSGKLKKEIPLGEISIPTNIPGCYMNLSPKFVVSLSGTIESSMSFSLSSEIRLSYDSDKDKKPKLSAYNSKPESDISLSAKAEIFVGIDLDPKIVAISKSLASLEVGARAGVEISASVDSNLHIDSDGEMTSTSDVLLLNTSDNTAHACNVCVKGSIDFVIDSSAKLTICLATVETPIVKFSLPLGNFYCSDRLGFGLGICPNRAYKTTFNVTDSSGHAIKNTEVTVDYTTAYTDSNGNVTFYCKDGSHDYSVATDSTYYSDSVEIKEGGKVINLKADGSGVFKITATENISVPKQTTSAVTGLLVPTTTTVAVPSVDAKQKIISSGDMGENVHYILYADGFMLVYGYGTIEDYNYVYGDGTTLDERVKEISIENTDDTKAITTIGDYAFSGFANLTEIHIPDTITTIGSHAFSGCRNLKSIELPDSVVNIGQGIFEDCDSLTDYNIPTKVTELPSYMFSGCDLITSITVPETIIKISDYAFGGCVSLKEVVIPKTVKSIGNYIFENCPRLEKITIPYAGYSESQVASNENCCLQNMFNGDYRNVESSADYYTIVWNAIPRSLKSITITGGKAVPSNAFENLSSLTEINLPETVTIIHDNAFKGCSGLKSIDFIPSKVKNIGDYAFSECSNVTSIIIPKGVNTIGNYAFSGCSNATEIIIPEGVNTIGDYAFESCAVLEEIVLPSSLINIGDYSFSKCTSLKEISIPEKVYYIGDGAFSDCTSLKNVVVPGNVSEIGRWAFSGCNDIKEIVIEEGVTNIGESAFNDCTALEKLTLPFAESSICGYFFNGSSSGAYEVADRCYIPHSLKSIVIKGDTNIDSNAFYGLKSLEEITVIGDISKIEDYSFSGCTGLKRLTIYDRDVEIDWADIPSSATIYGYTNSTIQKYASANNIKFVSLDDSEGLLGDCNNDGKVTVEDAIMLEQWLLGAGNLTNWHNANLCKDNEIDIFDMIEMRKLLT